MNPAIPQPPLHSPPPEQLPPPAPEDQWHRDFEGAVGDTAELYGIAFRELQQHLGTEVAIRLADPLLDRIVRTCAAQATAIEEHRHQQLKQQAYQQALEQQAAAGGVRGMAQPW